MNFFGGNASPTERVQVVERKRMITVIIVAAGFTVAAAAVTIYAFLTAENGFEDQEGFHHVSTSEPNVPPCPTKEQDDGALTSMFPEPHSH